MNWDEELPGGPLGPQVKAVIDELQERQLPYRSLSTPAAYNKFMEKSLAAAQKVWSAVNQDDAAHAVANIEAVRYVLYLALTTRHRRVGTACIDYLDRLLLGHVDYAAENAQRIYTLLVKHARSAYMVEHTLYKLNDEDLLYHIAQSSKTEIARLKHLYHDEIDNNGKLVPADFAALAHRACYRLCQLNISRAGALVSTAQTPQTRDTAEYYVAQHSDDNALLHQIIAESSSSQHREMALKRLLANSNDDPAWVEDLALNRPNREIRQLVLKQKGSMRVMRSAKLLKIALGVAEHELTICASAINILINRTETDYSAEFLELARHDEKLHGRITYNGLPMPPFLMPLIALYLASREHPMAWPVFMEFAHDLAYPVYLETQSRWCDSLDLGNVAGIVMSLKRNIGLKPFYLKVLQYAADSVPHNPALQQKFLTTIKRITPFDGEKLSTIGRP